MTKPKQEKPTQKTPSRAQMLKTTKERISAYIEFLYAFGFADEEVALLLQDELNSIIRKRRAVGIHRFSPAPLQQRWHSVKDL